MIEIRHQRGGATPAHRAAQRAAALRPLRAGAALAAALASLAGAGPARAADGGGWQQWPATPRLGYETVKFDDGTKMGLVGTTYLVQPLPGLCVGPAVYGSASGPYGGLFTVGAEAALCTTLVGPLRLVAGVYAGGGGGGGNAPVGGGLMLRPHADLLWDFGPFRAGLSVSHVSFPSGQMGSTQLGVIAEVDTGFAALAGAAPAVGGRPRGGIGFDRILAVGGAYRPRGGTLNTNGVPLASTIGLVGARAEAALTGPWYLGIEANGAASGGAAGYAELLGTIGAGWPLDAAGALVLGGRVALGMGGGGGMPTGGGLLAKAALDARWRFSPTLALVAEAGWASAPQGDFGVPYGNLALQWQLEPAPGAPAQTVRQDWSIGVEQVFNAARTNGPAKNLQQVSLRYTRFVGEPFYLSGQVQSAYGGDAGAFSVGLFAAGAQWRPAPPLELGAEFAFGAAGGGGVATGGGFVVKPMAFVGVELSPHWSLRRGGGWFKAVNGDLASGVADLTLVYRFDVAGPR